MRPMISRVTASIVAPNYGRMLTPGQVVDLDEHLPHGGTVGDLVDLDWFELIPAPAPEAVPVASVPAPLAKQPPRRSPAGPPTDLGRHKE